LFIMVNTAKSEKGPGGPTEFVNPALVLRLTERFEYTCIYKYI